MVVTYMIFWDCSKLTLCKNSTLFSTPFKDSKILLTEDPRRESTKKFTKMTNFTHFTEQNESKETDNKKITIKDKKESETSSAFSDDSSKTFSSMIINQGPSRLKTFLIIDKPNWHEKRQLEYIKYSKESMRSQEVQQKAIKDQILLLLDNVQIFKVRFWLRFDPKYKRTLCGQHRFYL